MLNTNKLLNLTFSMVSAPCVFGSLEDLAAKVLSLVLDDVALDIQCKDYEGACSPEVQDIARRTRNSTVRTQATQQLNDFIAEKLNLLRTASSSGNFHKMVQSSHNACWGIPEYQSLAFTDPFKEELDLRAQESLHIFMAGWFIPIMWVSALAGLGFLVICFSRKPRCRSSRHVVNGSAKQQAPCTGASTRPTMNLSMGMFVVAVLMNVVLFLYAHLHVGAEANVIIKLVGVEAKQTAWTKFSVVDLIQRLIDEDSYLLAGLITALSVVWPYVKLLCLLLLAFGFPFTMSDDNREKCLFWLDRLGKYSMLDVYFIILVFGFLQLEVGSLKDSLLLGPDFLTLQMEIMPCSGIVALILGVLMSIFLNQVALAMLRRRVEKLEGRKPGEFLGNEKEALCNHAWHVRMGTAFKQEMRRSGIVLVTLAMMLCAALMSIGWFLYFCDTEVHGVAGFLKNMQEPGTTSTPFSFFNLAAFTLKQARLQTEWDYYLGVIFLMVCQLVFAGVLPLLQVVCMLVLWLKPLTLQSQKRLNLCIQGLSAVASMEVFLFAVMVGYLEIENLSEHFFYKVEKGSVSEVLHTANHWGLIDKAHFISLDLAYHWGMIVLAWGATLWCTLSSLIIEWSKQAERDRLDAFQRQQASEVVEGAGYAAEISSGRMGLLGEAQAKLQYFSAVMKWMEISDLKGENAMTEFWLQCHRGGNTSSSRGATDLHKPLLETEGLSPKLLPHARSLDQLSGG